MTGPGPGPNGQPTDLDRDVIALVIAYTEHDGDGFAAILAGREDSRAFMDLVFRLVEVAAAAFARIYRDRLGLDPDGEVPDETLAADLRGYLTGWP